MDIRHSLFTGSHETFFANSGETSSSNVDVLSLHDTTAHGKVAASELEVWVAGWGMRLVVFKSVQVLITFAAHLAAVRLLFLHAKSAWVGR